MTTYKRGDVVFVPFPFSSQTASKKRPAVVISSSLYNEKTNDLVILAVTSKVEKSTDVGEGLIADWQSAGLLKPSSVKPAISTIEQVLVLKKLGSLAANDIPAVNLMLTALLDLR
jgi:mRNA interferase MazF